MHTTEHDSITNSLWKGIDHWSQDCLQVPIIHAHYDSAFVQTMAWLVFISVGVALTVSVLMLLRQLLRMSFRRKPLRQANDRRSAFKWWAFSTFLAGYILYLIGFYYEGTSHSLLAYVFRPFLSSLEMFVSHSDLIEVDHHCKDNPYYMSLFSLVHFSAVAVSASFAVNCFWRRIVFWVRRHWWAIGPQADELYVFFGLGECHLLLAHDLHRHAVAGRSERILFIDLPGQVHEEAQRLSFSHIFGLFSYKAEQVRSIVGLHPVLMHSSQSPHLLDQADADTFDALGLHDLRGIMGKARRVHLFFLSPDEDRNVKSMLNVLQDHAFDQKSPVAYCGARRNVVNISLSGISRAEVRLVDDASLAIDVLKTKPLPLSQGPGYLAHPIRYVETDAREGCVTSPFTAMLLGMGSTGQDALRFVYEFGAFAGPDGQKSPFRCYAVDRRMTAIEGPFSQEIPALPDLCRAGEIELWSEDVASASFWQRMPRVIDDLNYVVIALGNDEADITLGVQLLQYASRHRQRGLERLAIFVRAYDPANEMHLHRTVAYYGESCPGVLHVFGTRAELYAKRSIVDNGMLQLASQFYDSYNRVAGGTDQPTWSQRHADAKKSGPMSLPLRWQSLRRKEFQDLENSLHIYTKRLLLHPDYLERSFPLPTQFSSVADLSPQTPAADSFHRCLVRLSIGEHLRWNASHLMLGYTEMSDGQKLQATSSCDERTKTHKYLTDWKNLTEDIRRYDYVVVYTSFMADNTAARRAKASREESL